jgi:hypothetical protein
VAALDKKRCTTCLQEFPASNFYSKGNRRDSICKDCKKKKAKATYVRERKSTPIKELNRFMTLVKEVEMEILNEFENELVSLIKKGTKDENYECREPEKAAR